MTVERREIFIPGFMTINSDKNLYSIAFSILRVLLPSLNRSDICRVRFARPKAPEFINQNNSTKFPSFIITLINSELVQLIIRAKKAHNYLTTKDIDLNFLNSEVASELPNRKIFINEVLSPLDQLQYITIKEIAKSLVFKFVWHCAGRFLVIKMNDLRAHIVTSVSDLHVINKSYGQFSSIRSPPTASHNISHKN